VVDGWSTNDPGGLALVRQQAQLAKNTGPAADAGSKTPILVPVASGELDSCSMCLAWQACERDSILATVVGIVQCSWLVACPYQDPDTLSSRTIERCHLKLLPWS
jgi:hypothetical protein